VAIGASSSSSSRWGRLDGPGSSRGAEGWCARWPSQSSATCCEAGRISCRCLGWCWHRCCCCGWGCCCWSVCCWCCCQGKPERAGGKGRQVAGMDDYCSALQRAGCWAQTPSLDAGRGEGALGAPGGAGGLLGQAGMGRAELVTSEHLQRAGVTGVESARCRPFWLSCMSFRWCCCCRCCHLGPSGSSQGAAGSRHQQHPSMLGQS